MYRNKCGRSKVQKRMKFEVSNKYEESRIEFG